MIKSSLFTCIKTTAACIALAGLMWSPAKADLLTNGGFDDTTGFVNQGNDTMTLGPGSTTMTGWTVTTNDLAWIGPNNPFGVTDSTSPSTGYFLDLQGFSDGPPYAGVQQTIATCATCGYQLTFYLGSSGGNSAIQASAGGTSQTFTSTNGGTQNNLWELETLNFIATGSSTTIALNGITAAQGIYIGLDDVDLEQTSGPISAVPEPSTWAMMILGFLGLGFLAHRRRNALRVA